jgi:hypothetical protein
MIIMAIPTPEEREKAEREAANGNKLAIAMLKAWAKEEKKLAKKAKKSVKKQ